MIDDLSTNEPTVDPVAFGEYKNLPVYPVTNFKPEPVKEKIGKSLGEAREHDGVTPQGQTSDFERMAVAKALGIENMANKGAFQDQAERIIEWARAEGAKTTSEIVSKIHYLSSIVGGGGHQNLYNLSVYAGLKLQEMELKSQLKNYRGGK